MGGEEIAADEVVRIDPERLHDRQEGRCRHPRLASQIVLKGSVWDAGPLAEEAHADLLGFHNPFDACDNFSVVGDH